MLLLMRASGLVAALVLAGPVSAQQAPTNTIAKSREACEQAQSSPAPDGSLPVGYQKYCGARFVCYTGIPLDCAAGYQAVSRHLESRMLLLEGRLPAMTRRFSASD